MIGYAPDRRNAWTVGVAASFALFFGFLVVMAMFHRSATVYGTEIVDLAAVHGDQCERPASQGWLAEAQNTLSNVAYALAGALILLRGRSWAAMLLGGNLAILAIMSGLYHATLAYDLQILDIIWVYAALLSLSVYAAFVQTRTPSFIWLPWWTWLAFGLVWIATAIAVMLAGYGFLSVTGMALLTAFMAVATLLAFVSRDFDWLGWVVGGLLAVAIPFFGYMIRKPLKWDSDAVFAILAVLLVLQMLMVFVANRPLGGKLVWELLIIGGALGLGLLFRLSDGYAKGGGSVAEKWMCAPDSPFQPHAWWHVLSAAALLLSYDLLAQVNRRNRASGDLPAVLADPEPEKA
ncbi:ceramidase domain-containing protein [Aureimonas leprariae]|nr:ceramidase domain-containing protein [Aureimonas leprariae]